MECLSSNKQILQYECPFYYCTLIPKSQLTILLYPVYNYNL